MRLLDRYLLVEWLKGFGLAVAAMLGVLMLASLYGNIGDLLADGAHPREVFFYYAILLPGFVPAVMPLSLLVSLLYVFSNLHRQNEIIAMRAAGLSLWRITRPVWTAAALLTLVLVWFNASTVPWSVEQARAFRENLHLGAERRARPGEHIGLIADLTYDNQPDHRRWLIDHFSENENYAEGVHIYELDDRGRDHRRIYAKEGVFDDTTNQWIFKDGREMLFDDQGKGIVNSLAFTEKAFPKLSERPAIMLALQKRADDLSLNELRSALDFAPPATNPSMNSYAVRYYSILARPFICLIVVALAVPFAVAGVRVSPMVGASKAIGLFFAYYIVGGVCTHLGDQHTIPALVAAWLPIVLMLALAMWLFRRAA